jgi:hypothetical protein
MENIKVGDKGKYLSLGEWLDCEVLEIKTNTRSNGPDLLIKILPGPHYRCRSKTTIRSKNFIKD